MVLVAGKTPSWAQLLDIFGGGLRPYNTSCASLVSILSIFSLCFAWPFEARALCLFICSFADSLTRWYRLPGCMFACEPLLVST